MAEEKKFQQFYQSDLLLSGPVTFNSDGELLVCCLDGNVLNIGEDGEASVWLETGLVPQCVTFDGDGVANICDHASKSILTYSEAQGLVKEVDTYEDLPLMGPNCLVIDDENTIYFTDSGPVGDSTLARPCGSLFYIGPDKCILPLLENCLAHPSGVVVCGSGATACVYVAETHKNRILRGCQSPKGVFNFSVFKQFSGGMGPTGMCTDASGNIYVARHDYGAENAVGCITILSPRGKELAEIDTPAPHITGITLGPESSPYLYVTEVSTKSIYRIPISDLPE
jgi:sugar lactone lactonase YvrE